MNLLWSTQMLVADFSTLIASSSQSRNDRLRMMTLRSPLMVKPQPAIVAPELPRIVLFERTRSMPEHEMVPETRITAAPVEPSALVSAEALVTVVADARRHRWCRRSGWPSRPGRSAAARSAVRCAGGVVSGGVVGPEVEVGRRSASAARLPFTVTSSKRGRVRGDQIRPASSTPNWCRSPIRAPSTNPRIVLPRHSIRSVYQVPVLTVAGNARAR